MTINLDFGELVKEHRKVQGFSQEEFGEKLGKIHYRSGQNHAECDPNTGECSTHYDTFDPHESLTSLFKHMKESDLGKAVLLIAGRLILDQVLTGGQIRNSLLKSFR